MPYQQSQGSRTTLAVIEICLGLCALGGGYAIMTGAFGFTQYLPRSWLVGIPFVDYTVPGLVLLVVIGGGMLLAAMTVIHQRLGQGPVLLSAAMGLIIVGFEAVEIAIIDRNPLAVVPPTIVQQILIAALGLVIFGVAGGLWWREYRPSRRLAQRS